jgi:vacuolar-type H+-ATPase subunit F/Vma7
LRDSLVMGLVIGDNNMVTGFRLIGIEGAEAISVAEAKETLKEALNRNDLAIIVISEEFSGDQQIREIIDDIRRSRTVPLIVEVPGSNEKISEVNLADLVSKSLGVRM